MANAWIVSICLLFWAGQVFADPLNPGLLDIREHRLLGIGEPRQIESLIASDDLQAVAVIEGKPGPPLSNEPAFKSVKVYRLDRNQNGSVEPIFSLHSKDKDFSQVEFINSNLLRVRSRLEDPNNDSGLSLKARNGYTVYDLKTGSEFDLTSKLALENIRDLRALDQNHYLVVTGEPGMPTALQTFSVVRYNGIERPLVLGKIRNKAWAKDLLSRPTLEQGQSAWTFTGTHMTARFSVWDEESNSFKVKMLEINGDHFDLVDADPRGIETSSWILGTSHFKRRMGVDSLEVERQSDNAVFELSDSDHFVDLLSWAAEGVVAHSRIEGLLYYDLSDPKSVHQSMLGSKFWLGQAVTSKGIASLKESNGHWTLGIHTFTDCDSSLDK